MTLHLHWKKSSASANGGNCVEVRSDRAAVRDTKNPCAEILIDVRPLISAIQRGDVR